MRRFFLRLSLFLAIVVLLDIAYGLFCLNYRRTVKAGMTHLDNVAAYETEAEILIFGSSRARRNYDTEIITDSLGKTVFDCGYNSMGIEFMYPRLQQILKRYTPSMILYDITPVYDIMKQKSNSSSIKPMKPFFHDSIFYHTIREMDFIEWIKCHSGSYRYHGELKRYIDDQTNKEKFINGYSPLNGIKKVKFVKHNKMVPDSAKLHLLENFIKLCREKNIELVFIISPYYKNDMGDQGAALRELVKPYNIPVYDHFNDTAFLNDTTLYWDEAHLNTKGAKMFTSMIMTDILSNMRQKSRSQTELP